MTSLEVLDPGPLTLVQDLGRPGLAHLGVGAAGAADRAAHALALRLVGTAADAAALEALGGGLAVRAVGDTWVAVTGARGPIDLDGARIDANTPTRMPTGATLRLGPAEFGIRYTVAVRGGVEVPRVLRSRSRDTLAALGPAPLRAGDVLPIGQEPHDPVPAVDAVPVDVPTTGALDLEVLPGPRLDWFAESAWAALLDAEWRVSPRADRTGIRLDGPALVRARGDELPSEGMVAGGIQVSPDGAPTVLGPDHPVTGGYPVIAVVTDATRDRLAQARPGQPVRLRRATLRR